jgi:type II secretory pathway pseudopilin PulG
VSIRQLRARLVRDESGMGIVEILVALMIFSIVVIGMAASMISMTRLTGDAAARETATNLAAAEIDRVASIQDAFTVVDAVTPKQVVVDGIKFFVETNTGWVGANGNTGKCGLGVGQLLYKRVRVTVTWDNMFLKNPVRADSALAPSTRINDPTAGTILISVKSGESGDGQPGVALSATKTSGGAGLAEPIDPTDGDGCSYVLKAPPGTYDLTVNKSGYINTAQQLYPTVEHITVAAGTTTPVDLQADSAHTYTLKYAANSPLAVKLPTNLNVTYFGQSAAAPITELGTGTKKLYPWTSGYQVLAGDPATCTAVDPEKWLENNGTTPKWAGVRAAKVPASPGGFANLPAAMGVADVVIPGASTSQFFLTATAQSVTSGGNPGCAAAATTIYKFDKFAGASTQTIALPYGVWKLTVGATAGSTTTPITTGVTIRNASISLDASGYPLTTITTGPSAFASGNLTFDPRMLK